MEQRAANRRGLGHQAVIEMERHLRALGGGILRIERSGGREGSGGRFDIAAAIEQMAAMEVVFGVLGRDRQGSVDRRQGRVEPLEQHLDRRQDAQYAVVTRLARGGRPNERGGALEVAAA